MSELPTIDPLKVAKREAEKLRSQVADSSFRETQLEVLAEALRDERDEAVQQRDEALEKLNSVQAPVPDITSLPSEK